MKKNTFVLFVTVLFTLLSVADETEEFLTAGELLEGCEEGAGPGAPNQYCMQYVFGYVQTVISLQSADSSQPQLFCIDPEQSSLPEVTDRMTVYLRSQNGRMQQEAYTLVGEALAKHYPCERSRF